MKIAILGGGQLAMLLIQAGKPLGHEFRFLDPAEHPPAFGLGVHIRGAYDDRDAIVDLINGCDVATFEFENIPAHAIEFLASHLPVFPSADALAVSQDRFTEKSLFEELGIPTPAFVRVDSLDDLQIGIEDLQFPAVLKTRRSGYDGKGQAVLRHAADLPAAWERLGRVPLLLEQFITFEREVSLICVRGQSGETRFYPLIENQHREGILRVSRAPAASSEHIQDIAEGYARLLLKKLAYVGVMTIEFCVVETPNGASLQAIEMAPRVHNSGHLTIEAARTSQFENHLRAITGQPLGGTEFTGVAAMINLISTIPDLSSLEGHRNIFVHLYGKEPRPGRKLGHVTIVAVSPRELEERIRELCALESINQ